MMQMAATSNVNQDTMALIPESTQYALPEMSEPAVTAALNDTREEAVLAGLFVAGLMPRRSLSKPVVEGLERVAMVHASPAIRYNAASVLLQATGVSNLPSIEYRTLLLGFRGPQTARLRSLLELRRLARRP